MSGTKTKAKKNKTKGPVLMIAACAIAALIVSILVQLWMSPDFNGFDKEALPVPIVRYLTNDDGSVSIAEDEDGGVYSWRKHPVLIVGDSLTQGARKEIDKVVPDATFDAKVSRNMATGVQILRDWDKAGLVADDAIIVVCLAHNITGSTLNDAQDIVDMLRSGQSLIFMTGHGHSDMSPINDLIRGFSAQYEYVAVADWDLTIAQSPALLGADGVHINNNRGNSLYADLIVSALEVARPKE